MLAPHHITTAFTFLVRKSAAFVTTTVLAVKAYHAYYALPAPPFHDPHVQMFMKGLYKVCTPSKARNGSGGSMPLPPEMLLDMLAFWYNRAKQGKLDGWRNLIMGLLQYVCARRIGDLKRLTHSQLVVKPALQGIDWYIPKSKTGRLLQPIPESTASGHPVAPLLREFLTHHAPKDQGPLFRRTCFRGSLCVWQPPVQPRTPTTPNPI